MATTTPKIETRPEEHYAGIRTQVPFTELPVIIPESIVEVENWLLQHPRFGSLLRGWRERGAIPVKAKLMALGGMAIGFAGFWFGSHPGPWLTAAVVLLMLTGLIYVFSRPS